MEEAQQRITRRRPPKTVNSAAKGKTKRNVGQDGRESGGEVKKKATKKRSLFNGAKCKFYAWVMYVSKYDVCPLLT